jgi:hypothetical protein
MTKPSTTMTQTGALRKNAGTASSAEITRTGYYGTECAAAATGCRYECCQGDEAERGDAEADGKGRRVSGSDRAGQCDVDQCEYDEDRGDGAGERRGADDRLVCGHGMSFTADGSWMGGSPTMNVDGVGRASGSTVARLADALRGSSGVRPGSAADSRRANRSASRRGVRSARGRHRCRVRRRRPAASCRSEDPPYLSCRVTGPEKFHSAPGSSAAGDGWCGWA